MFIEIIRKPGTAGGDLVPRRSACSSTGGGGGVSPCTSPEPLRTRRLDAVALVLPSSTGSRRDWPGGSRSTGPSSGCARTRSAAGLAAGELALGLFRIMYGPVKTTWSGRMWTASPVVLRGVLLGTGAVIGSARPRRTCPGRTCEAEDERGVVGRLDALDRPCPASPGRPMLDEVEFAYPLARRAERTLDRVLDVLGTTLRPTGGPNALLPSLTVTVLRSAEISGGCLARSGEGVVSSGRT